jgi:hypothetical protein
MYRDCHVLYVNAIVTCCTSNYCYYYCYCYYYYCHSASLFCWYDCHDCHYYND